MKYSFFFMFIARFKFSLITMVVLSIFTTTAFSEPFKIRFSHPDSDINAKVKMATKFQSLIQQRLGESVAVVEIVNSDDIDAESEAKGVLEGYVDIAAPKVSELQNYSSRFKLFDLPFLFVTPDAAYKFVKGEYGDRFINLIARHGFVGFGFLNRGMTQFSSDDEIILPRDLRKLKVNAEGGDVISSEMKILRAKINKASKGKVYDLLKNKEINAQEDIWPVILSNKFYEFQPYMLESNHRYFGYMVLTSQKFWKTVPENIRPVVKQSLLDSISLGNAIALENEQADRLNIISTKKTKIHSMTVSERRQWLNIVQPIWMEFEGDIGTGLIDAAASTR